MSMPPAGALLCIVSKLFSNSAWDHVGVVVRHPATGELLFLEADFGGVKLRSLEERVRRSKSNEIAIRKLSVVRSSSMREKFYAFAQEMLGRPYEIGAGPVLVRVTDPLAKKERERLSALLIDKRAQIDEITKELQTAALTNFQKRLLQSERARVEDDWEKINIRLKKELEVNSAIEMAKDDLNPATVEKHDLSRVFCSELVAAAYQRVGLLESYPPAFYYTPKDFSSEQQYPPGVHLLKSARLGKEKFLRRKARAPKETEDMSKMRSFRGVVEGDTPSRASRNLIKDALKRTPVYSMVPDEYKRSHLLKSFRARIIEQGDIVFEQGEYGDRIFVVGSGDLERFMSKGDEDPILLSTLGPRTTFGLTAFTFNSPRVSTIRAKERTLLWELDRPTFELFKDTSSDIQSIVSIADTRALRRMLQDHFLFKRLDKLGPNEMSAFFLVKFRAGETVFNQGDAGDNFYIVKRGELERHIRHPKLHRNGDRKNGNDGGEDDVSSLSKTFEPGQSFGELSLMYNAPRAATVRARTDVECWAISSESFHRLSLGGGTQYLRAIFNHNASVKKDGESYMTRDDLLKFAGVHAFPEEERERLANLLVSLVTSNRERDPIAEKKEDSDQRDKKEPEDDTEKDAASKVDDADDEELLMDFWEFVRFDIVLNQPAAEMNFAFRLADQNNSGFISLDEMQYLLQEYADIDEKAKKMLIEESGRLKELFGRDGSRLLSAKDFMESSQDILPPLFRKDIAELTQHMLNIDLEGTDVARTDADDLSFVEADGALAVIGSQFMKYAPRSSVPSMSTVRMYSTSTESSILPKWMQRLDWGHLLSVGVAGAVSRTSVAPLDRLKILMQTGGTKSFSEGWIAAARQMVKQDTSLWRAVFRGNGANVMRIVPSAAIQLLVVNRLREMEIIRQLMAGPQRASSASAAGSPNAEMKVHLVSGGTRARAVEAVLVGGIAGIMAATAVYPLDFVRGRLTLQRKGFEPYRGALHGISDSIRKEGVTSMYRGLGPTIAGVFPYVGISFAMYETLRPILPRKNDGSGAPTIGSSIACGAMASAVAQFAAFPLDTCRRRMQVAGFDSQSSAKATRFIDMWREIGREMGWRGYFRGVLPNMFKALPASAVSFVAYEQLRGSFTSAETAMDRFFKESANRVRT